MVLQTAPRYDLGVAMLPKRQRLLLSLLDALGGRVGNLDFQKLLFLYCQTEAEGLYDFVPYRFGAFSFTSYADRRRLVERALLADDQHHWVLTDAGWHESASARSPAQATFVKATSHLRGDALVAQTYRQFPYYATNSEIAAGVLKGDRSAQRQVNDARPTGTAQLLTIGYEGLSLEDYLNKLLRAGVTVLCDVRRNPLSRKYGFSKRTLSHACVGIGIRYEHLPALGIDSAERQGLDTQDSYDALFARYERDCLPHQDQALDSIAGWLAAGQIVALTCYERLPHQCHRHCVAEAIERRLPTRRAVHL
jgi:hypothetical protein